MFGKGQGVMFGKGKNEIKAEYLFGPGRGEGVQNDLP